MSVTTVAILLDWAQHVENFAEYALDTTDPGDSDITRSMLEHISEK